ncbi:MAG TPA: DUF3015 family protein [Nitrospiraceae bacterium]|nr:DUF3015 family protein [Nitrospiraceae bacterium]
MRKGLLVLQLIVALLAVQTGVVLAAGVTDNGPGCGLGKVMWEGSTNANSIGAELLISTTNNTILPWQAFGITTGNFGCKNNGKLWSEHKVNMFATVNFDNLSQEMAQGQGEHLASLASLMGVPAEQQAEFYAMTQDRYNALVKAGEASPVAMIKAINDAIATHPVLAQASTR